MSKLYMFAERDGRSMEVKVDPAHMERQARDLRALGYTVSFLNEDERIRFGLFAKQLRDAA